MEQIRNFLELIVKYSDLVKRTCDFALNEINQFIPKEKKNDAPSESQQTGNE